MLSQEQLVPVKTQVATLAVKYRASNVHQSVTPTPPIHAPPFHAPLQQPLPPQSVTPVAPVPPAPAPAPASVSLDALLGKGALAALLNRQSATPQPSTPQLQPAPVPVPVPAPVAALRSPTPQRAEPQKPATPDPLALLGALRGAGLLPPPPPSGATPVKQPLAPPPPPYGPTTTTPAAVTPTPAAGGVPAHMNLASILASARSLAAAAAAQPVIASGDISLTVSSLKQYVLQIIPCYISILLV